MSAALPVKCDVLVVGAGFAGAVCAERLAAAGKHVLVVDKRKHIGGNAYDEVDSHGVLIHTYGPHIFHTNGKRIFEYLSAFTDWRFYEHRVRAVSTAAVPHPDQSYDAELAVQSQSRRGRSGSVPGGRTRTPGSDPDQRGRCTDSVGEDLCDKFFRGYTRKQWGVDLSQLSAGVAARIPTRTNDDDRYFTDDFQFMPAAGYTAMFRRMLANPKIEIRLSTDYFELRQSVQCDHTVFTGPIDAYFDYRFGKLPYRSLSFEHEHIGARARYQDVGTVNYPNDHEFTRITEFKHLTGQSHEGTSIVREYPSDRGDPYYPIPRPENEALFKQYQALAQTEEAVSFVGRLAQYRYYNMDQVVGAALAAVSRLV